MQCIEGSTVAHAVCSLGLGCQSCTDVYTILVDCSVCV